MDGAGDAIRTRDIYLGKVVLYQLSYSRVFGRDAIEKTPALTDFSGMLPSEYHWRGCVSRPSSAWDGVEPQRCGHGGVWCCHQGVTVNRESGADDNGGKVVKTSTDEHQFAEHLAVRARLAS